jgi:anti-sigma B factor antagonist
MASEPLQVERLFAELGGRGVLRLKGPLTIENLPDFQNAIRRENVPTIILDLTEVPYIDSAGLGSLVSVYVSRHKSGQRMALSGVNARIINLLEITNMQQLFLIFPSLADAIDALATRGQLSPVSLIRT